MKEMREFAAKRGQEMRERAMATAKKRKEEFIGARVPKELRDKVIQRASDEGVSVSILIRQILERAFSESGERSTPTMANRQVAAAKDDGKVLLKNKFSNVLGWESISLNTGINCACCGKRLNEGENATIGLTFNGAAPVVLCNRCKESF